MFQRPCVPVTRVSAWSCLHQGPTLRLFLLRCIDRPTDLVRQPPQTVVSGKSSRSTSLHRKSLEYATEPGRLQGIAAQRKKVVARADRFSAEHGRIDFRHRRLQFVLGRNEPVGGLRHERRGQPDPPLFCPAAFGDLINYQNPAGILNSANRPERYSRIAASVVCVLSRTTTAAATSSPRVGCGTGEHCRLDDSRMAQ